MTEQLQTTVFTIHMNYMIKKIDLAHNQSELDEICAENKKIYNLLLKEIGIRT
jgi:hypothetical protein